MKYFVSRNLLPSFIWEGELTVEGMGKFGLVSDIDKEGTVILFHLDHQWPY